MTFKMPGLPRKSTINQFKKLMKKSGKSRTNKKSGGTEPSKKIATYEQFFSLKEKQTFSDIDPYGEEEWGNFNMVKFDSANIGDEIYLYNGEFFGNITDISDKSIRISLRRNNFILPIHRFYEYPFFKKVEMD